MSGPRLTGGRARGRPLAAPVPSSARPTSARVREALFSLIGHDLDGVTVLDAFGGSGLLGLEAWSRGARVTIVERDRRAARSIAANLRALGSDAVLRVGDVLRLVPELVGDGGFDVVLVDPPYALDPGPILEALVPVVGDALVLESEAGTPAPEVAGLVLDRRRVYGGSAVTVYRVGTGGPDAGADRAPEAPDH